MLQDPKFDTSLVLVSLFILDDLDRHNLIGLVVQTLERLSKAALSQEVDNLVPIVNMVLHDDLVVTILVIVARIVQLSRRHSIDFVSIQAQKVHLLVVKKLCLLKVSHAVFESLECLSHSQGELRHLLFFFPLWWLFLLLLLLR